jgi:TP901 family phage tail tape measure protein
MANAIAELFIAVGADVDKAISGLNSVNSSIDNFSTLSKAALPASAALAGAGVAIGAGFVGAVQTAADFEKQMSGVKAVMSPAEVEQFGSALSALALTLGKDTTFTAREAAAGIEELIKAGIPAEAILNGAAQAALALAAATGTPVADAATIAAQAMNAFGQNASQLAGTVDFLAGTVNASAADMSDLKFGLQSVGAVAATVGLSFNDTATALGLFANNGLRGQDAGTSLKTMLTNLIPQTEKEKKLFRELGLVTEDGANQFFDATGKVKSLADISGVLQNALAGMTQEQKLSTLQLLFGTDAMRAAAILAKEGADGVNKLTGEISKIKASDAAAQRLNNFSGAMQQLQGSVETLAITLGQRLLPFLTKLAAFATILVNAFLGLPEPIQTVIAVLAGIAGIALVVVGGLGLIAAGIGILGPSFVALGGVLAVAGPAIGAALTLMLGPVGLIIGAVALLAVAWSNNWFDIQGKVGAAAGFIQEHLGIITTALLALTGPIGLMVIAWQNNLGDIQGKAAALGDFFTNSFLPALGSVGQFLQTNVLPFFTALADLGVARLQAAIAALSAFWTTTFLPALQATGDFMNQFVLPPFQALANIIGTVIKPLLDGLGTVLGPIGDQLKAIFADVGANAAANLQSNTAQIQAEAAATRAAAGVSTGPVLNAPLINTVNISSEVDADRFLDRVADVLGGAESRATPPQPAFGGGAF